MKNTELWIAGDRTRFFLIPEGYELNSGKFRIATLQGLTKWIDPEDLGAFEITEAQARQWVKDELGQALGEIRGSIDEKFADWRRRLHEFTNTPVNDDTTLTPNAAPALLDFLKKLAGVVGNSLSGDDHRVEAARDTMANLRKRLKETGIDLDERFTQFPDRLAELCPKMEDEPQGPKDVPDKPLDKT